MLTNHSQAGRIYYQGVLIVIVALALASFFIYPHVRAKRQAGMDQNLPAQVTAIDNQTPGVDTTQHASPQPLQENPGTGPGRKP